MQDMDAVYRQHFRMVYQYLMSLTHQPDVAVIYLVLVMILTAGVHKLETRLRTNER